MSILALRSKAPSGKTSSGKPFNVLNATFMVILSVMCVYPFYLQLCVALSDGPAVAAGQVRFLPVNLNIETFRYILTDGQLMIGRAIANSMLYTVAGTLYAVAITFITAYPLSKQWLKGRRVIMFLFVITWIFDAGIVPAFIVYQKLGFVNNWLVMVIPWGFNTFLLIITMTYLRSIPAELEEAALMDGAGDLRILWSVYLPLAKPILATISVFYAIQVWNQFLVPLIYLQKPDLAPIQLVLYQLLLSGDAQSGNFQQITSNGVTILPVNLRAATMVLAILPIMLVFPFAQRYFSKGILLGSVKG